MKSVFDANVVQELKNRINRLSTDSQPQWGKMSVDQMLAHLNVMYEMAFENKYPKPGGIKRWLLKAFVKNSVVNEKPYPKNSRTASQFLITDQRQFATEKARLLAYLDKTHQLGKNHFEGKESHSFGALTATEWNNMLFKHLDHHLNQFGK